MKLTDLKNEIDAGFAETRTRFDEVGARFVQVDARLAQIDARFDKIDARFAEVDARFDKVDARFDSMERRIVAEGEITRRHFDIVAEAIRAEVRLGLEKAIAIGERIDRRLAENESAHRTYERALDNHEVRLRTLEQK